MGYKKLLIDYLWKYWYYKLFSFIDIVDLYYFGNNIKDIYLLI